MIDELNEESAVLGAILIENTAISMAAKYIDQSDFSQASNAIIWKAMDTMADNQTAIDILTLTHELEKGGMIQRIGGRERIIELMEVVPTAANVEHYAQAVRERSIKRKLEAAGEKIRHIAQKKNAGEAVELAQKELGRIAKKAAPSDVIGLTDAVQDAYRHVQAVHEAGEEVTGLSTGFGELDKLLAGFHSRELVIVAARPAMGKTALATSFALTAAKRQARTLIFSLEMDARQLGMRVLSTEANVQLQNMRRANCSGDDFDRMMKTASRLELPISIVDDADLTISELRTIAREQNAKGKLRLVLVDYLQLLRAPGAERREREVAMISAGLKALAKELDVTVVALSQLNRALEGRPNKRPHLGDLRESGGLEQDADVVMFVYRDEYYNKKTEEQGVAELIVSKQRQGPTGTARVGFVAERTLFTDEVQNQRQSVGRV